MACVPVALNIFTNCFNKAADTDVDFPRVALPTEALTGVQ
jgi:hypothetical protein